MRVLSLAWIEFRTTMRLKSVVFWVLAWPMLWILLTAFVFVPPQHGFTISIAVLETPGSSSLASMLLKSLANSSSNTVKLIHVSSCCYPCNDTARNLIRLEGYDVVVVPQCEADKVFSEGLSAYVTIFVKSANPSTSYLYSGVTMSQLEELMVRVSIERLLGISKDLAKCLGPKAIPKLFGAAYPIIPLIKRVAPEAKWSRGQVLGVYIVGTMGYAAILSAMTSGAGLFAYRRDGDLLRRILSSPTRFTTIALADLVSSTMITSIACALAVALGIPLGAKLPLDPRELSTWIAVASIVTGLINAYLAGLLIAAAVREPRGASGIAVVISLVLVFTTGIWWPPKEMLPKPMQVVADWSPLSLPFDIAKKELVWHQPLSVISSELLRLALLSIALLITVVAIYWRRFERIAHKALA